MQEIIQVQKLEKWSRIPNKSNDCDKGFVFSNVYTTNISKGVSSPVSSGITLNSNTDGIALVFGTLPTNKTKNLMVKEAFVSLNEPLEAKVVNYSDDFVKIDPFTTLTEFVVVKISTGQPNVVESLDITERGQRGFGSTGML